jgi:hypothetical protein
MTKFLAYPGGDFVPRIQVADALSFVPRLVFKNRYAFWTSYQHQNIPTLVVALVQPVTL